MNFILKKLLSTLLILLIVLSGVFYTYIEEKKTAHAQAGFLSGVGSCVVANITSSVIDSLTSLAGSVIPGLGLEVPVNDQVQRDNTTQILNNQTTLLNKEFVLDCIVWATQKEVLDQITNSGISFIQSGNFSGQPFFVEEPAMFFADLKDQTIDVFMDEIFSVSMLNNPYKNAIERAIRRNRGSGTRVPFEIYSQYTLGTRGSAVSDPVLFMNDYSQGGLEGFGEFISNPANVPMMTYVMTNTEIDRRVAETEQMYRDFKDEGRGFLPQLDSEGKVLTPGSVLETQTEELIGIGLESLQASDEVSELITAIVSGLISNLLKDSGGLINL